MSKDKSMRPLILLYVQPSRHPTIHYRSLKLNERSVRQHSMLPHPGVQTPNLCQSRTFFPVEIQRLGETRRLHDLLGLGKLCFSAPLGRLGPSLGVEEIVPPPEAARIVTNEALVMDIVMLGAGPEGQEMVQTPRELVAAVGINGLEETQNDPDIHGQDVEILGQGAEQNGRAHGSDT
jgi:hypothetical protein